MRGATILILLAGCSALPPFEPVASDGSPPPPPVREGFFRQRWVLDQGSFTLLVKVARPDTVHAVALDDLGTTLAEATLHSVKRESRAIDARMISAMVADLALIYLPPQSGYRAVRLKKTGELGLHRQGVVRTRTEIWTSRSHIRIKGGKSFEIDGRRYRASVEVE